MYFSSCGLLFVPFLESVFPSLLDIEKFPCLDRHTLVDAMTKAEGKRITSPTLRLYDRARKPLCVSSRIEAPLVH